MNKSLSCREIHWLKPLEINVKFSSIFNLLYKLLNPLTGVGAYKHPERGVCSKNHKKCPERAMLYLSEPVDRERVAEPRGIFSKPKSAGH